MSRLPALLALLLLAAAVRAENPVPEVQKAMKAAENGDAAGARAAVADALKRKLTIEDRRRLAQVWQDLKDWTRAEALLRALTKEAPKDPALRLHLACVTALKGDRGETLAELARATALAPDAADRQRIAFLHADLKDWAPARALLDALIAEKPADASLRFDRAAVLVRTGPRELALEDLAAALAADPAPEARRRAARLYGELGEHAKARSQLEALAKESPSDPAPLLDQAELAVKAGDRRAARKALEAALKRKPGADALRRASAAYLRNADYAESAAAARSAIALAPASASPRLDLADALARSGKKEEALAALASASDGVAPDLQERQRMALLYQDLGERDRARGMMEALIAAQPGDPQLRLNMAFFAADARDEKGARRALAEARALALDPDDSRRAVALEERLVEQAAEEAARAAPPPAPVPVPPPAAVPPAPAPTPTASSATASAGAIAREREALRLLAAGEHAKAAVLLDALLAKSPGEPRLLLERAYAWEGTGDRKAALRALEGVTAPKADFERRRRAALLRQRLKDPGALSALEALSGERPDDASLLADVGLARWLAGKGDAAVAALKAAIAKDPRTLSPYLTLGTIYAAGGRFAEEAALYGSAPPDGGTPEMRELLRAARATAEAKISR